MKNMFKKQGLEEYTEQEFIDLLSYIFNPTGDVHEIEKRVDQIVDHFEHITQHPGGSDVIFYPEGDNDGYPEGIVREIKRWRAEQGLPGFKQ